MKELENQIVELCQGFIADSAKDSKAARQRMRRATLQIAKLGKEYRKLSIEADKKA
jgi:hypothetical protein